VLSPDDSEPDYTPGGVPCSTVLPGGRILPSTDVTLYENAASIGNDENGTGVTCGGGVPTTDECSFNAPNPRWKDLMTGPHASFYEEACAEAWAWLRDNGIVTAGGKLRQDVVDDAVFWRTGSVLRDLTLPPILAPSGSGLTMSDWEKVFSQPFNNAPRPMHLHFMRRTNKSDVSLIKIRFNQFFEP
jgi:hypothetical protein